MKDVNAAPYSISKWGSIDGHHSWKDTITVIKLIDQQSFIAYTGVNFIHLILDHFSLPLSTLFIDEAEPFFICLQ